MPVIIIAYILDYMNRPQYIHIINCISCCLPKIYNNYITQIKKETKDTVHQSDQVRTYDLQICHCLCIAISDKTIIMIAIITVRPVRHPQSMPFWRVHALRKVVYPGSLPTVTAYPGWRTSIHQPGPPLRWSWRRTVTIRGYPKHQHRQKRPDSASGGPVSRYLNLPMAGKNGCVWPKPADWAEGDHSLLRDGWGRCSTFRCPVVCNLTRSWMIGTGNRYISMVKNVLYRFQMISNGIHAESYRCPPNLGQLDVATATGQASVISLCTLRGLIEAMVNKDHKADGKCKIKEDSVPDPIRSNRPSQKRLVTLLRPSDQKYV